MQHKNVTSGPDSTARIIDLRARRPGVDGAPVAPLVPAEVDLRNFLEFPLDAMRLRDSDMAASDPVAFKAAVLLWCAAWHQLPSASLPDNDAMLARLAGYGRDVRNWRRAREKGALRGFVLCTDGRLYHPVIAEKALKAWDAKLAQRARTRDAREALEKVREERRRKVRGDAERGAGGVEAGCSAGGGGVDPSLAHGQPLENPQTASSVTDSIKGREGNRDSTTGSGTDPAYIPKASPSAPADAGAPPPPPAQSSLEPPKPRPIRDVLWQDGVPIIRALTGKNPDPCRRFLGKLLQASGDDCVRVMNALRQAHEMQPADPGSWLMGACKISGTTDRGAGRDDWIAARLARVSGASAPDGYAGTTIDGAVG